mmetsp:Transcript_29393/g.61553  ORF Transcript_29393/g.61553 Transcript_29393/m.61553 type:complete len:214 (+) Transcript_29393:270-911(+)
MLRDDEVEHQVDDVDGQPDEQQRHQAGAIELHDLVLRLGDGHEDDHDERNARGVGEQRLMVLHRREHCRRPLSRQLPDDERQQDGEQQLEEEALRLYAHVRDREEQREEEGRGEDADEVGEQREQQGEREVALSGLCERDARVDRGGHATEEQEADLEGAVEEGELAGDERERRRDEENRGDAEGDGAPHAERGEDVVGLEGEAGDDEDHDHA